MLPLKGLKKIRIICISLNISQQKLKNSDFGLPDSKLLYFYLLPLWQQNILK